MNASALTLHSHPIVIRHVLPSGGEVMPPQDSRGSRAPGSPVAGQELLLISRRENPQVFHFTERDGQRQIPLRPDIGTSQRHKVIDIHAPWPEPWNRQ